MIICNKTTTPEQILQKNEVQMDEVSGFYFMANINRFIGCPILTLELKGNKSKRVNLKKANVTKKLNL